MIVVRGRTRLGCRVGRLAQRSEGDGGTLSPAPETRAPLGPTNHVPSKLRYLSGTGVCINKKGSAGIVPTLPFLYAQR